MSQNPYDDFASKLVAMGYFPVPITPMTKMPGQCVPGRGFVGIPGWQCLTVPIATPQPKAGIGVRLGNGLVCVDFDDDEHALILSDLFPPSPVNKRGQTAWSAFYKTDVIIPNQNYYSKDGKLVLQILADRKQTVLPPTIHEDTGRMSGATVAVCLIRR